MKLNRAGAEKSAAEFAFGSAIIILLVVGAVFYRNVAAGELRLLALRETSAAHDLRQTKIILIAGMVLGLLVTAVAGWNVSRDNSRRQFAEKAAQEGERKYRMLIEGIKDHAIIMLGPRGEIRSWNAGAERMLGFTFEEIFGQQFSRLFLADDIERGRPEEILRIAVASGKYEEQGMRIRRDGTFCLMRATFTASHDSAGNLCGFSVIGRDLTESNESSAKYRGLMEAAPDAMVVVNQGGEIVLLNVQAEKQFGYPRDELLGQKVTNIIPRGFAERLIADDLRSSEDARAQQIGTGVELNARRRDGSEFPIEIMLSPLESAEGILVTAAIRDISIRRATEKHLHQMESRYRGLLEAAPDAMVVVNQGGEIVLLNVQAEKQFGYRRDELLGQKVKNIIPEGFAERLIADDLRSDEDALAQQIGTGIELNARRKDGSEFPIEIMLSPLESAEGMLITAAIRDISVRRAAEKHLGQMEGRYRGLLEAAPDAMVVVNQAGEIVLLNVQAEKQFGYRRDELLGQKVTNIIPEGFAARLVADALRSDEDALAQQIGTGIELTGRRKDGDEFPIEIMLSPLESAEGILVTAAVRDISVRKHMERLKDEFVATVSHELRTPLTSISGSLGLLVGQWAGKLPESAARLMTIAHANSQRLVRLINDILDIEKIEFGRVVFKLSRVDVCALVEQAIEGNRGFAEGYDVGVRLDATSASCEVNADADRLAQVVTNLLSNAIKFSPVDGEVLVRVEKNGGVVRILVYDHGAGIPADFRSRLFKKFAQADATSTRQKGGTGLGLSIAKQIVERLGGKIGFRDAPGGGTIFHVELPIWDGTADWEIDIDAQVGAARILLCEDDRDVATVLREQLRHTGFAADFAYTAAAAIERAEVINYAAFVVDLQLPDDDGVSLIVRLRALKQYREVPIIVVSANPDKGSNDTRSSALNVLGWLSKPVEFEHLFGIVRASIPSRILACDGQIRAAAGKCDVLPETPVEIVCDHLPIAPDDGIKEVV